MALIEGFRVQNYRALRDVTLGKLSNQQKAEPLTPFTVVIGKNGAGKSTLFDAFGFVADCLSHDIETACDMKQRGGFEGLRSRGTSAPIAFEIYYREGPKERPMTYELALEVDASGRPFVKNELLKQRRKGQTHGRPYPFLRLNHGAGHVHTRGGSIRIAGSAGFQSTWWEVILPSAFCSTSCRDCWRAIPGLRNRCRDRRAGHRSPSVQSIPQRTRYVGRCRGAQVADDVPACH